MKRRVLILGAAVVLVAVAATTLVRPTTTYFATDGRTELGLPVASAEPVLIGIHLLAPNGTDTVEVRGVHPMMTEGGSPEVFLYDPGSSLELVGMIVERDWHNPAGATLVPFAPVTFGADDPKQIVVRIAPGSPRVTLGPVAVDFSVNGGAVETQVFDVHARACFDEPIEYDCRPPTE